MGSLIVNRFNRSPLCSDPCPLGLQEKVLLLKDCSVKEILDPPEFPKHFCYRIHSRPHNSD